MNIMLPDLLIMDHKRIKSLGTELRSECVKDNVSEEACFNLFRTLKALVHAHAKAEEYTVYALFEESGTAAHDDLRDFMLEGYEEHDLIDLLLKEMGQAEEVTPQWKAKLKVLTELLDHHVKEEEDDFLPKVRQAVGPEELLDLGVVYARERDDIFSKKIGRTKSPAANIPDVSEQRGV